MVIDFDKIAMQTINGFKGGQGELDMAGFSDDKVKIMRNVLKPQASAGRHLHSSNSEIIYVLQGELTITCDGEREIVRGNCTTAPWDINIVTRISAPKMLYS